MPVKMQKTYLEGSQRELDCCSSIRHDPRANNEKDARFTVMDEQPDYELYLHNVVTIIRKMASDVHRKRIASTEPDDTRAGSEAAYRMVLGMMQSQAMACSIDTSKFGLAGFDPFVDDLDV